MHIKADLKSSLNPKKGSIPPLDKKLQLGTGTVIDHRVGYLQNQVTGNISKVWRQF